MQHRRVKRRPGVQGGGFALLMVMILVATAVILGLSYLSSASIHTAVSKNLILQAQARYLAESGVQHGLYLLKNDPDVSGVKGPFTLRGCSETYNVTITPVAGEANAWTISSTANVGSSRRSTSAKVSRVACPPINMRSGMLVGNGSITSPWGLTINGDIHANGSITNWGAVNGSVTATNGISDPFNRITGSENGSAAAVTPAVVTTAQYSGTYSLNGVNYNAVTCTEVGLSPTTKLEDNSELAGGGSITPGNIGGVVYVKPQGGTVQLCENLDFQGTLVIDGNVEIKGKNVTLTAVNGFPAIVASGSVKIDKDCSAVVNGLVVARQGIVSNSSNSSSGLVINGGLLCDSTGVSSGLAGTYTVTYQKDLAQIYDFSLNSSARVPKVSVVNWND